MIKSILVVELTRFGDLLVIIPALHALRKEFPGASIVLVADSRYADLARWAAPFVTAVPVKTPWSLAPFLKGLLRIRRQRFDLALSMSPARRNAAFVLASSSRRKVGYLTSRDSLTPYLHETLVEAFGTSLVRNEIYGRDHLVHRPAKILSAMGFGGTDSPGPPDLPATVTASISSRLQEAGIPSGSRYAAVQPSSGWTFRTWSAANFAVLAGALRTQLHLPVVFFAPGDEWEILERIRDWVPVAAAAAIVRTDTVIEAAALIRGSVLFVGNDSGPLHLATLLGIPSIGLFGPAPPSLTGPINTRNVNLYQQVECSPCDQRRCIRPDNPCIGLITPEQVLEAARRLASRSSDTGGE